MFATSKYTPSTTLPRAKNGYNAHTNRYRYRFNGQENDSETHGDGNALDFGARIYDNRSGRFLSVDPFYLTFSSNTPYEFSQNSPNRYIDYNGQYKLDPFYKGKYKKFNKYLKVGIQELLVSGKLTEKLMELGNLNEDQLVEIFSYDKGPVIVIQECGGIAEYDISTNRIWIDPGLVLQLEEAKTKEEREAALLAIVEAITHETVHFGRDQKIDPKNKYNPDFANNKFNRAISDYVSFASSETELSKYFQCSTPSGNQEIGDLFEACVWGLNFNSSDGKAPNAKSALEDAQKAIDTSKDDNKSCLPSSNCID